MTAVARAVDEPSWMSGELSLGDGRWDSRAAKLASIRAINAQHDLNGRPELCTPEPVWAAECDAKETQRRVASGERPEPRG